MPKVVISDRIRFSRKLLPKKMIMKRYDRAVYNDSKCEKCENLPDRHNDICDDCPAFIGRYRFFSKEEARNGVWSVPQGDVIAVTQTLLARYPDLEIVDKRKRIPFKHPIKFTGKLFGKGEVDEDGRPRANQKLVVNKWFKHKHGVIKAAPRTGKTVMATNCYCRLGQKTVIIASQKEWLKQFYETATGRAPPVFRGDKMIKLGKRNARRKAQTNIPELQEKTGRQIIRYVERFSQLEKAKEYYDIVLITPQALMKDPQRIMKFLNGRYSMCIVDEQHKGNAHATMQVLAMLNMAARLSLSATTLRKDSRDKFGELIMGPVVAVSKTNALVPQIFFEKTGITIKPMPKMWPTAYKRICYNIDRNRMLVKQAFADLRAGHKVIIIPVDYIEHIKGLVKMINRQAMINNKKRDEDWPIELAKAFHGKTERAEILDWVDSTKWDVPNKWVKAEDRGPAPRILVARASMVKEGIDFARPTMLYVALPMSGNARAGAPMFYQLANRVCTPIAGKRQPAIRIFVDDINMFKGAISGLLWHELFPNSNLKNATGGRYYISKQQFAAAKAYTAKTKTVDQKHSHIFAGSWV